LFTKNIKIFHGIKKLFFPQDGVLLENARKLLSTEGGIDERRLDEEGFQRILSHLSHIARRRPYNLITTRELPDKDDKTTVSFN